MFQAMLVDFRGLNTILVRFLVENTDTIMKYILNRLIILSGF